MRPLILAVAVLCLAGCQGPDVSADKGPSPSGPAATSNPKDLVPSPNFDELGDLSMALRVWGHDVKVGDPLDQVVDVFPDTRRAIESSDLPPRFGAGFRARVWEKGDDGFGVILSGGHLCAAFASFDKTDEDRLSQILRGEEAVLRRPLTQMADGPHTRYWFADDAQAGKDPKERVMVCAYKDPHGGLKVTAAVGLVTVMDALGASPKAAKLDSVHVEELLGQSQANAPSNTNTKP